MAGNFYLSNPLLKSARVQYPYTADELQEYIRCKDDPIYFIKQYVKITTIDHGIVTFKLFEYQEKLIKALHENRRVIAMFPRQMGKTVTVAAYITWYLLFNDAKTVAILANKAAQAREIMTRIQLMVESLPMFLQQGVIEWNKGSIKFENNSVAFTAATTGSAIRGKSVSLLYVDETAAIANSVADDFFTSTYPTISSGETSKIVLTSTPMGLNHFWKFWTEAEAGVNGFVPIRVEYTEHPKRDQNWAETQKQLLGELKYRQEVLMDFLGSAANLINADALQRLAVKRPLTTAEGGDLKIYAGPAKKVISDAGPVLPGTYVLVVDPSEGVGGDSSAFTIIRIDTTPYQLVAVYKSNVVQPMVFPTIINKWAKEYNMAYVLVEINKVDQVAFILHNDYEYENMLYVNRDHKGQRIGIGSRPQLGLKTDKKTKRIGCFTLKDLVETNKLQINDADVISELSTFTETKGSYSAEDGKHDDLVMTLVIFGWLVTQQYFQELTNTDLRRKLHESRLLAIEEDILPIGYLNTGLEEELGNQWVTYNN